MLGLPTLSYVVARNPRIDLGYEVKSGYAYWRFYKATDRRLTQGREAHGTIPSASGCWTRCRPCSWC